MKKIFFLCFLILLTSCGANNLGTDTTNSEPNEIQSSTDDTPAGEDQTINPGQESVGDIPTLLSGLPNIYLGDENFRFCVAQNIDACIADFKFQNPSDTSCDDFVTESGKEMCEASETTTQALELESIELCDGLSEDGADVCKNEVATAIGVKSGDVESCDILSEIYINECKNQVVTSNAKQSRDESICDSVILSEGSFGYEKDFCIQEVAIQIESDEFEKQQLEEEQRFQEELNAQIVEEEIIQEEVPVDVEVQ